MTEALKRRVAELEAAVATATLAERDALLAELAELLKQIEAPHGHHRPECDDALDEMFDNMPV